MSSREYSWFTVKNSSLFFTDFFLNSIISFLYTEHKIVIVSVFKSWEVMLTWVSMQVIQKVWLQYKTALTAMKYIEQKTAVLFWFRLSRYLLLFNFFTEDVYRLYYSSVEWLHQQLLFIVSNFDRVDLELSK